LAATADLANLLSEKNLKYAFDLFDIDENGQITPRELKHILSNKN
jgi:Ca2+-binding EF-hand superfamily protein